MIYLDSAATSLQKPPAVARACSYAISHYASPGRGGHKPAMDAAAAAFACREAAARLFQVPKPEQVVFTNNATHGLNIAIKALVRPGGTVVISGYEHNAVTRPLHAIPDVTVRVAAGQLFRPEETVEAFRKALTPEVTAAVFTHVSNVFGMILPIQELARLCRERGVPFILDASQSAGCLPVHLEELGAAFIAMPGHKGLYGPQGTGLLLCGQTPPPLLEGGTGSESIRQEMPDFLPDRLADLVLSHDVAPAVNQIELHPFCQQRASRELMDRYGIRAMAWAPFAEGREGIFANLELAEIGAPYGKTPAQVILRWLRQEGIVAIPKSVHRERIEQNFALDDFALTDDDMARIRALDRAESLILDVPATGEVYRLHGIRFEQ